MSRTAPWLWPNLLSLDAPPVALVWQDLAARAFDAPIRPAARIVLGLTVWAVYLADRLLDVRGAGPIPDTARHRFYRSHRRALAALLAAVLIPDALLAIAELRRAVFVHGLVVAACAGAYLWIFPPRASGWEKQVVAAILFSAGVLLAPAAWVGAGRVLIPGTLFAGLCLSNLILIETWERDIRARFLWLPPAVLAAIAAVRSAGAWDVAIAASGALLAAVALASPRLSQNAKRVLADIVLLTPLLFR